jgi:hypothetical protein
MPCRVLRRFLFFMVALFTGLKMGTPTPPCQCAHMSCIQTWWTQSTSSFPFDTGAASRGMFSPLVEAGQFRDLNCANTAIKRTVSALKQTAYYAATRD